MLNACSAREALRRAVPQGPGQGSRWWRMFFSAIWLIYLVQPVADLFNHHYGPLYIAGGIAIVAAFCVIYVTLLSRWDVRGRTYWDVAALGALAVLAGIAYHGGEPLWIYVSAAAGVTISPPRTAFRAVLAATGLFTIFSLVNHDSVSDFFVAVLPTLLVGFAMIGFRRQIELTRELEQARETVAKLAANEERLRLARDMHDLTGQSLSMITLKSELAAKLLGRVQASADADRAREQITEVARVSRQTLHDIREAVSGYRRPTLAVEVITGRTALEAAGIELDDDPKLTLLSGTFDADAEAALAWCLREAVTNVVRHSGARHCTARLTEGDRQLSLEVTDDGRGLAPAAPSSAPPAAPVVPPGSGGYGGGTGLRGMSERLDAVGGTLELGQNTSNDYGFRLVATVPAVSQRPANRTAART